MWTGIRGMGDGAIHQGRVGIVWIRIASLDRELTPQLVQLCVEEQSGGLAGECGSGRIVPGCRGGRVSALAGG